MIQACADQGIFPDFHTLTEKERRKKVAKKEERKRPPLPPLPLTYCYHGITIGVKIVRKAAAGEQDRQQEYVCG